MKVLDSNLHSQELNTIFSQAPINIRIIRAEDYIVEFANEYYLKIVGKSKDIIGKPLFEVFPELIEQGIKRIIDKVLETGVPYFGKEFPVDIFKNNTSKRHYFNFTYTPLRATDDTITNLMLVSTDVTEQVNYQIKSQEAEHLYHELIYSSPSMMAVLKGESMIIDVANDAILKSWGKGKDVFNKSLFDVLPETVEQGYDKLLLEVFRTGVPFFAYEQSVGMVRDGKTEMGFYNFVYQPQRNVHGKIEGVAVIANEVTKQAIININIKESELHFRMIAELMTEKINSAEPDGTVIYYNKSWLDYTGASFDALMNDGWAKWIHPDELETVHKNWNHSVATGEDFAMDLQLLNLHGEYRWHRQKARPIKDEDGKIKLWISSGSDIHQQKQEKEILERAVIKRTAELEKKHRELQKKNNEISETREKLLSEYSRSLIEASLDPLFVISPKGKITDMNQAAIKATGVVRQRLTDTNFCEYFTDVNNACEVYKEVFLKGFVTDYPLTIKDHKLTDVLFNGSVYRDERGGVIGAVMVARDITEQKKAEQQLLDAKETAEKAQEIAESATKSKQQFLSNMSHEIRTPMNAIIGFTKVLLKTDLTKKQKEYLNAIELSGDALIVLINDILDLAKVEAGKMTFEQVPFKLSATISSMLHLFEPKLQEKNIKLIKEYDKRIPEVLLGDPIRLNQVMLNLLSNAVKFTSAGKITVNVHLLEEDDKKVTVEFSIKDTGIGIKKENLETIFGSFQQASNDTTRLFGGTGLGLSIVKQLIEPQGGHISVESEYNHGSTFIFTLTFLKTKAKIELMTDILQLDLEMKEVKVLVVEDMALNQLLMRTILDDFSFNCDIAENGKIALEKLDNNPYDIILMDLQMPEMDGFETTEYIRKKLKLTIPIIALTADVTTMDVGKCKQAGMDDYIAKPVDEKLLYRKMVTLIKSAVITSKAKFPKENIVEKVKCIDLAYLNTRTKSNPKLIKEMILIYLEQTPSLVQSMKAGFHAQDWKLLSSSVHKMIPSFSIMGMHKNFEDMAHKVQEYSTSQLLSDEISEMIVHLEMVCLQACEELQEELSRL